MEPIDAWYEQFVRETKGKLEKEGVVDFRDIEFPSQPGRGYSFTAPKNFAWVEKRRRRASLLVGKEKSWADLAGGKYDYVAPKGDFTNPGARWEIPVGDIKKMKEVVDALVRICKVRHN